MTATAEGAVAWSAATEDAADAIRAVLNRADVGFSASCGRGRCGWYVAREDFFLARRALLDDHRVRELGINVVDPALPSKEGESPN